MSEEPNRRIGANVAILLVVCLLAGSYFLKGTLLLLMISNGTYPEEIYPEWIGMTSEALTVALVAVCGVILFLLGYFSMFSVRNVARATCGRLHDRTNGIALIFTILLTILLLWLRWKTGVIMGEETPNLPWYEGTLIYRMQQYIIPGMYLSLAWCADREGRFKRRNLLLFLLLVSQVGLSFITASKAGAFAFLFLLILFVLFRRERLEIDYRLLAISAMFGLIVFALGNEIRSQVLASASSIEIRDIANGEYIRALRSTAFNLLNRFIGIEGVSLFCSTYVCSAFDFSNFDCFLGGCIGEKFTRDVIHVVNPFDHRSPGVFGGLVMGMGYVPAIFFLSGFPIIYHRIDLFLRKMCRTASPRIVLHFGTFLFLMEGTFAWQELLVIFVAVAFLLIFDAVVFCDVRRLTPVNSQGKHFKCATIN